MIYGKIEVVLNFLLQISQIYVLLCFQCECDIITLTYTCSHHFIIYIYRSVKNIR